MVLLIFHFDEVIGEIAQFLNKLSFSNFFNEKHKTISLLFVKLEHLFDIEFLFGRVVVEGEIKNKFEKMYKLLCVISFDDEDLCDFLRSLIMVVINQYFEDAVIVVGLFM